MKINQVRFDHFEMDSNDISQLLDWAPLLFEHSLDNVILHDAQGLSIYGNPRVLKLLNCQSQQSLCDFLETYSDFSYHEALFKVLETKQSTNLIVEMNNEYLSRMIYDLVNFSPIKNKQGQLLGVLAVGRDLDFLKQQQIKEMKKQAGTLRALLDSFPYPTWMKNKKGEFLAFNTAFGKLIGVSDHHEAIGKTDFDFFQAQSGQGYVDYDKEIMATGLPNRIVEQITQADGQTFWACTHKSPLMVDGEIAGTVGFARDISEERELQAQIAQRENEYATLVENLPIAIMVYDLECRGIMMNDHYVRFVRRPAVEILGKKPTESWGAHILNITAEYYEQQIKEVIRTGEPMHFDLMYMLDFDATAKNPNQARATYLQGQEDVSVNQYMLVPQKSTQGDISGVIAIMSDVTELYLSRQRMEYMAYHDSLTGLANRVLFSIRLSDTLKQAAERKQPCAVMLLDLDDFKAINDSMGHPVGDMILKEVAARITNAYKKRHFCARFGGDEFSVLLENASDKKEIELLAEDMLAAITQVYEIDEIQYFISASIGIALYPEDASNADDLMKYADSAMYHAKGLGRNHFNFYVSTLTEQAKQQLKIETALRSAVQNEELYLEYQPIVDLETRRVTGVEALCRWQSPKLGMVRPDAFIPAAEQTGIIIELGKYLMKVAFEAAYIINVNRTEAITVSVNLSARQFNEPQFVSQVMALFREKQCKPHWIKFEITETLLLESKPLVVDALNAFDEYGIKISLDDFGTGQSALAYLQKFPIHQVKIDRSFIKEIHQNTHSAVLVNAIVTLAVMLDKELVAEGVETEIHAELLRSFGCKHGQGYLYAKSLCLDSLIQYLSITNI